MLKELFCEIGSTYRTVAGSWDVSASARTMRGGGGWALRSQVGEVDFAASDEGLTM